jgi:hypothetical protein
MKAIHYYVIINNSRSATICRATAKKYLSRREAANCKRFECLSDALDYLFEQPCFRYRNNADSFITYKQVTDFMTYEEYGFGTNKKLPWEV